MMEAHVKALKRWFDIVFVCLSKDFTAISPAVGVNALEWIHVQK